MKAIPNAKPLTDAETIKALECCMSKSACKECPVPSDIADRLLCIPYLMEKECGNCIHYQICDPYVSPKESFPEIKGGCPHYKSKSLFVELPCKYGDVVYKIHIRHKLMREVKVVGFHLGDFPTLRGHKRKQYLVCYADYTLYHIDLDQIGKTVFLTEEQAKAKLKEMG